jgi:hypothetical protein
VLAASGVGRSSNTTTGRAGDKRLGDRTKRGIIMGNREQATCDMVICAAAHDLISVGTADAASVNDAQRDNRHAIHSAPGAHRWSPVEQGARGHSPHAYRARRCHVAQQGKGRGGVDLTRRHPAGTGRANWRLMSKAGQADTSLSQDLDQTSAGVFFHRNLRRHSCNFSACKTLFGFFARVLWADFLMGYFRAREKCLIGGRLVRPGDVVDLRDVPALNLQPLDGAARRLKAASITPAVLHPGPGSHGRLLALARSVGATSTDVASVDAARDFVSAWADKHRS